MVRFFFFVRYISEISPLFLHQNMCSSYEVPEKSYITEMILLFVFLFDLILYFPSTIFQMCLAQGPQRSDAGEARTRCLSVSSQALYH